MRLYTTITDKFKPFRAIILMQVVSLHWFYNNWHGFEAVAVLNIRLKVSAINDDNIYIRETVLGGVK